MANPDGTPDDRDAHEKMEFHLGQRREDGLTRCWGLLDDLTAEALRAAFGSMCSPSAERRNDRVDVQWPSDGDGGTDGVPGGIDPDATGPDVPDPAARSDREDDAAQPFLPDLGPADVDPDGDATSGLDGPATDSDIATETDWPAGHAASGAADQPSDAPPLSDLQPASNDHADDDAAAAAVPECGDAAAGQSETDQPPTSRIGTGESETATPPGHLDGRPPDPPPDRAPGVAPDMSTGAVEGCRARRSQRRSGGRGRSGVARRRGRP